MNDCSCIYTPTSDWIHDDDFCDGPKICVSRLAFPCTDCGRTIPTGEQYEFAAYEWEGIIYRHKTCPVCLNIRDVLFCHDYPYGEITEYVQDWIDDCAPDIPWDKLAGLAPDARARICDWIEDSPYWREEDDE